MRNLMDNGIVESYGPLVDVKGSYTAQFEHVWTPSLRTLSKLTIGFRRFYSTVVGKKSSAVVMTIKHLRLQLDLSFTYISFSLSFHGSHSLKILVFNIPILVKTVIYIIKSQSLPLESRSF